MSVHSASAEIRLGPHVADRAPAGLPRARRQTRDVGRRQFRGGLEGGAAVGGRCAGRRLCRGNLRRTARTRRRSAARLDHAAPARVERGRSWNCRRRRRRVCRRRGCGSLRAGRAQSRRTGQRHRQTGILRLRLRRDRQSLAPGHWNFHRRCRTCLRPSHPRKAGDAAAQGLCGLGRGRAALAFGRQGVGADVPRALRLLAAVRQACRHARRERADWGRLRPLDGRRSKGGGRRREWIGHHRRRASRSGLAYSACGSRAANGRRDRVRRSRLPRGARFRTPRGAQIPGRRSRLRPRRRRE